MATILGSREIIPRSYEHRLGGSPTASRTFVVTVDEPVPSSQIVTALNIQHGTPHPDHNNLTCDGFTIEEQDRQHVQATFTYSVPEAETEDPSQPPWAQPDQWTFSSSNASVACTEHYPFNLPAGQENVGHPLTNTAGDVIVGISKAESELKITITGSRLELELSDLKKYVNCINESEWAGFPMHTVQFVGFSASPEKIEFDGESVNFWRISVDLVYRSSTHNIFLPNVGWNVIVNGQKQRAYTYITERGQRYKVPSPHPVSLNANGGFLCGQDQAAAAAWNGGTTVTDDGIDYYR